MSTKYRITIPRWEDFQHYKRRDPPWLRVYTRLHSDDKYLDLSGHQRGVLLGLWIEYARSGASTQIDGSYLEVSLKSLSSRLNLVIKLRDLEALNHAGFIRLDASKTLAKSKQDASPLQRQRQNSVTRAVDLDVATALDRILEEA